MAWPKGKRIIVCCRTDDLDPACKPEPGAIEATCAACGAQIVLSLASQRERALLGTAAVCVQCYADRPDDFESILVRQRPL